MLWLGDTPALAWTCVAAFVEACRHPGRPLRRRGLKAGNDRSRRVKVMSIIHGNQAVQPGSYTQNLINANAGAGYYRPLDAHQAYAQPLAMHITPTLASAIQGTVDLLGSTFSDHILPYFDTPLNRDNVALAKDFLTGIYGVAPSSQVP